MRMYKKLGLQRLETRPLCLVPKRPLSPFVNMYLLVIAATGEDLTTCQSKMHESEKAGESFQLQVQACEKVISPATRIAAMQSMSDVLRRQLTSYRTTLAEDRILLETSEKERLERKGKKQKKKKKKKKKGGSLAAQLGLSNDASLSMTSNEMLAVRYRMTRKRLLSLLLVDMGSRGDGSSTTSTEDGRQLDSVETKISKTWEDVPEDGSLEAKVAAFNAWFAAHNPRVNKLVAATVPMMRIGTLTTDTVSKDEIYLEVPVKACMSRQSAHEDDVMGPVLRDLAKKHPNGDAFHELLFHLMYERFARGPRSKWWP
jgi:hypothetical protein